MKNKQNGNIALIIIGTVAVFFALIWGVSEYLNHRERETVRQACARFGLESNRKTKFIQYTRSYNDCLTPQENGQWISAFNLRGE